MMKRKVMILGAGFHQLPGIRKSVELGYHTITVDYLSDNVGHQYAHESYICSVTDHEGVLKVAQELDIDGVVTFAEIATPTAAYVASKLGLCGSTKAVVGTMINKASFRKIQRENNLNTCQAISGQHFHDIEEYLCELAFPVMVKPADATSSRGVKRVDVLDTDECQAAFVCASKYSRTATVCIEEFATGIEVGGDAFLINGEIAFVAVTQKYKRNYIPIGHVFPSEIPHCIQEQIRHELAANCAVVGYQNGPLNFDVIIRKDGPVVLELTPRLGANGISQIIKRSTEVDLIEKTLAYSVGERMHFSSKNSGRRHSGSCVIWSDKPGRFHSITSADDLKAAVPEVFDYITNVQVGDDVGTFSRSGNSIGLVLFDCPSIHGYEEMVERLHDELNIRVF